jgi:hypothetical protein
MMSSFPFICSMTPSRPVHFTSGIFSISSLMPFSETDDIGPLGRRGSQDRSPLSIWQIFSPQTCSRLSGNGYLR